MKALFIFFLGLFTVLMFCLPFAADAGEARTILGLMFASMFASFVAGVLWSHATEVKEDTYYRGLMQQRARLGMYGQESTYKKKRRS